MTAQVSDILVYNGQNLRMATEPLEDYLLSIKLPHKLVAPWSYCWRGYYSKWAIDNNKLFLTEWEGFILHAQKVGMDYIFPDEEFVFAKWYSGTIRIPVGELVSYVHGGYESIHKGDLFLEFEEGVLINEYSKWLTDQR